LVFHGETIQIQDLFSAPMSNFRTFQDLREPCMIDYYFQSLLCIQYFNRFNLVINFSLFIALFHFQGGGRRKFP